MKRFLAIAIASSMLMFAGNALAAFSHGDSYTVGEAANGIGDSRHNLGALGHHIITGYDNGGNRVSTGTTEICIFCHTPHHTNTDAKPLWNRQMPNSNSYVSYGATIGGTTAGQGVGSPLRAGSVSIACLSCHDGVTALDSLVNAPGKGTNAGTQGWTFYEDGAPPALGTSINIGVLGAEGVERVNLGTNLTNDHPMNITYREGQAASLRPKSSVIATLNLTADLAATTNSDVTDNLWAVAGFISNTATIGDLLRSDGSSSGNVECSSCHDPHFNNKSWNEVNVTWCGTTDNCVSTNGAFLRRVGGNTASGVCRTCHNK